MAAGKITADGTAEVVKPKCGEISVSIKGTFGGGSVVLEKETNGVFYPAIDHATGSAIVSTAADDYHLSLGDGDRLRLVTTGSTAPAIDWQMSDYNR